MLSDIAQYNNKRANELEAKGKKVVKDESFMEQSILEMKSKGLQIFWMSKKLSQFGVDNLNMKHQCRAS